MKLIVSNAADEDLDTLLWSGLERFGKTQAVKYYDEILDLFERIAFNPRAFPEANISSEKLRFAIHKSHIIIFKIQNEVVTILRIRHQREDWR